ncbi:hypothetical protein HZS_5447, partial [Henneguya salminicola]
MDTINFLVFFSNILIIFGTNEFHQQDRKLVLSQMVFRHANRTPLFIYPNSPCQNKYYMDGLGAITREGLKYAYLFGKVLRDRYRTAENTTLLRGDYYKEIHARSTGVDRCIQTVQTILSSIYQPEHTRYRWNEQLNWYPFPIKSVPVHQDDVYHIYLHKILRSTDSDCPRLHQIMRSRYNGPKIAAFFLKNSQLIKKLTDLTGINITSHNLWDIYQTLQIEYLDSQNEKPVCGKIPTWLTPNLLLTIEEITYEFLNIRYDPVAEESEQNITRLLGGPLLTMLIENMNIDFLDFNRPKLYMYSAVYHDSTIYCLLASLGIKREAYIQFSTALIFEQFLNSSNQMELELYLYDSPFTKPNFLKLEFPKCSYPCGIEQFATYINFLNNRNYKDDCCVDR